MRSEEPPAAPSRLWWAYLAILLLFGALGLIALVVQLGAGRFQADQVALAVGATVLNLLGLLGLWGHIRSRPFGDPLFWRLVLVMIAAQLAFSAFQFGSALALPGGSPERSVAWLGLGSAAFGLPLLFALWRYAFRSPGLWARVGLSS